MVANKKICPACGRLFHPSNKQKYCSKDCRIKGLGRNKCKSCGSFALYDPHKAGYKKTLCKKCFNEWMRKRHELSLKCSKCGNEFIIKYNVKVANRKKWVCSSCRKIPVVCTKCGRIKEFFPGSVKIETYICSSCRSLPKEIYLLKCIQCGKVIRTKIPNRKYCSNACKLKYYYNTPRPAGGYCNECGAPLDDIKHHSKSHSVCDLCMYDRKRGYKDRAKYGEDANKVRDLRLIGVLSIIGKEFLKGEEKWLKRNQTWKMKLKKLGLTV